MEMRQRLADGEAELHRVELAAEEQRHDVHRAVRRDAGGLDLGEARGVMRRQLIDAGVEPQERQIMRGQDEHVGRHGAAQQLERFQIARQRVGIGLVRPDADIRRDLRQHLVAGDEEVELGTMEAGMLRRMAAADDDLPAPPADRDRHAVGEAVERARHGAHALGVLIAAPGEDLHRRLVETTAPIERDLVGGEGRVVAVAAQHARP